MAEQKTSPVRRVIKGVVYTALLIGAVGVGTVAGKLGQSEMVREFIKQELHPKPPEEVFQGKNTLTILVLGCDEDLAPGGKTVTKANARSDMMMVAKLDFQNNKITGLSIPRDTMVQLPGYDKHKINAYHVKGGDELSQKAVEHVLGIKIDRTFAINYDAFQEMVNIVGGVNVDVAKNLKYTDKAGGLFIDIPQGRQHLDGYNSMCFVRFRHDDSDFERQKRQKDFMLAFRGRLLSNPLKIGDVAEKARDMLNNELTPEEMASLLLFAKRVGSEKIQMGQLPVVDGPGSFLLVDRKQLKPTLKKFNLIVAPRKQYSYNK